MYNIGDEVTIISDLADHNGLNGLHIGSRMHQWAGETGTITHVTGEGNYFLDISGDMWQWNDAMLKPGKVVKAIKYKPEQRKWSKKPLEESVKSAIESIRSGYYKGTYLKLELEAQLSRGVHDSDDGYCSECDGEGSFDCYNSHAEVRDDDGNPVRAPFGDGNMREDSCDECEDGRIMCSNCDGNGDTGEDEWDDGQCERFIKNHVSEACRKATVYSRFCYDGSVDSEYMFTVPLTREGLNFAIEYIKAFKLLSEEIGNGLDVAGAGMHITILRSEDGDYPSGNGRIESLPFANFKTNMTKLMPALYLLASEDNKSRSLSYRQPGVELRSHGHAVAGAGSGTTGVLEWRVFETCYRRPEMLLDFICVIAKGLSYYAPSVKPVKFKSKVGKLEFISGSQEGVHRYFHTEKHLVALKQGLAYLLPDHRTQTEVLKLRNFKVTPSVLKRRDQKIIQRLETSWQDRRKSIKDELAQREARIRREYSASGLSSEVVEKAVAEYMTDYRKVYPITKRDFMKRELERALGCGDYGSKYSITI